VQFSQALRVSSPGRRWQSLQMSEREPCVKLQGLSLSLLAMVLLAACGDSGESQSQVLPAYQPESSAVPEARGAIDLTRRDDQGAVEVMIQPRNLMSPAGDLLEFDVSMSTHSVDLSMDLAKLSTLETDLGVRVAAGFWSGGSGHHVEGLLTFPEADPSGNRILDGARLITLRIEGVDAPVREFQWELLPDT